MFTRGPADVGVNLLSQGITTINAGEGDSSAPVGPDSARAVGWSTMREYFRRLEAAGTPLNVAQTVGHTQVRQIVIGDSARQASPAELQRMRGMVEEAMQAGAIGVSTALIYPPAVYASEEEITALTVGRRASTAVATSRTCATRVIDCSRRSTKRCASAATRTRPCTSST